MRPPVAIVSIVIILGASVWGLSTIKDLKKENADVSAALTAELAKQVRSVESGIEIFPIERSSYELSEEVTIAGKINPDYANGKDSLMRVSINGKPYLDYCSKSANVVNPNGDGDFSFTFPPLAFKDSASHNTEIQIAAAKGTCGDIQSEIVSNKIQIFPYSLELPGPGDAQVLLGTPNIFNKFQDPTIAGKTQPNNYVRVYVNLSKKDLQCITSKTPEPIFKGRADKDGYFSFDSIDMSNLQGGDNFVTVSASENQDLSSSCLDARSISDMGRFFVYTGTKNQ